MAANRIAQSTTNSRSMPQSNAAAGKGAKAGKADGKGKGIQKTGGDKGSKKTNDFEKGGRDRRSAKGAQMFEKGIRGLGKRIATKDSEKPTRERTTEAGVVAERKTSNRTKRDSQRAAVPEPGSDKKLRRTSKRQPGSRKPGTEQTKEERSALLARPM